MIGQDARLVTVVRLVDRLPVPPPPPQRGRGRPKVYPDRLFLKALVRTVLRAKGGVWHQQERAAGVVPPTASDTEAHGTNAQRAPGWHGWVSGWQLPLVTTVAAVWMPLAAELTPATAADHEVPPRLLKALPPAVRFVLGERHDHAPEVRAVGEQADRVLVASRSGR